MCVRVYVCVSAYICVCLCVSITESLCCTLEINAENTDRLALKYANSETLCDPRDGTVRGILQARILQRGAFPFSRGVFPTQGSHLGLLHCGQILYQLSHQGIPCVN